MLAAALLSLLAAAPEAEAPPRVYAGVYLHDVTKFDQKDGTFDVDVEMWAKWRGQLDPEALVIANAAEVQKDKLGEESDGDWHSTRWRVRGTLRGEFPLQSFPFDEQTLGVVLALDRHAGELTPDLASSGMSERFSITDWLYEPVFHPKVKQVTYRSDLGALFREGEPTQVNQVAFELYVHRPPLTIALKLFLPLLIVLLVALIAQLIPADVIEARSAVGVTALLSCFAFQYTLSDAIPSVSYLIFADRLFMVAYAVSGLTLLETVLVYRFDRAEKKRAAVWSDRLTLTLVPLGAAVVVLVFWPRAVVRPPLPAEPLVETPRFASTKKVVRIGTNILPSLLGAPGNQGVFWGTVHEEPDGRRWPFAVSSVPSIAGDGLRFAAGGDLEVRWQVRPDLKWSDGTPVTAEDLALAVKVSPNPHLREVLTEGKRTVMLRYDDRLAEAMEGFTPIPSAALSAATDGGYEAVRDYRRVTPLPGLGPFKVTSFTKEKAMVLERNPFFPGAAPSLERIEVQKFADVDAMIAAFEKGELDALVPNSISPEQASALKARRPDAVHIRPSSVQLALQPDLTEPRLGRREVRRAILEAIDREAVAREAYGESGRVSHVPVAGALPPGTTVVPYAPAHARETLKRLGLAGTTLPIFHEKKAVDQIIGARLVRDLGAAGLTVELHEVDKALDVAKKGKHGGLVLLVAIGERDAPPSRYWNLPLVDGRYDVSKRHDAFDDRVAALVEKEKRALYPERREQLRDQLFAAYAEALPNLPLVFAAERIVAVPSLQGWAHEDPTVRFGAGLEQWHFDDAVAAKVVEPVPTPAPPPEPTAPAGKKKPKKKKP
ncbi:MAG: hypothetical protein K1X89_28145 [Myxococcaceae bacterium]|nr:hypothetical protein [Myxococcaceae bacterium]